MMALKADNLHIGVFGGWNGFKSTFTSSTKKEVEEDNEDGLTKIFKSFESARFMKKLANTGIVGGEIGWRFFVKNQFFLDPTISIGYMQKTSDIIEKQKLVEQKFIKGFIAQYPEGKDYIEASLFTNEEYPIKIIPIHCLLKAGYAFNDKISAYGIVGGGINIVWTQIIFPDFYVEESSPHMEKQKKQLIKHQSFATTKVYLAFTAGAGVTVYASNSFSFFAEYRYTETFKYRFVGFYKHENPSMTMNSHCIIGGIQINV